MKQRDRAVKKLRQMAAVAAGTVMICAAFTAGFTVNAEEKAASSINVYMTVSDKGDIAKAKDGTAMAAKKVTVTDINGDGQFSFHEALIAAHIAWCDTGADGYAATITEYGSTVIKLWGVSDDVNYMFFTNSQGLDVGVGDDYVSGGDYLTASIISDRILKSDRIASFDKYRVDTLAPGEKITLKLKGHPGLAKTDEEKEDTPIADATVVDTEGKIYGKTNEDGSISLAFDQPGAYCLTARGAVPETVDMQNNQDIGGGYFFGYIGLEDMNEETIYGKINYQSYHIMVAYTENDYGEGPYPWEEVLWMDEDEFDEGEYDVNPFNDGYFLYDTEVIYKCPLIAPVCVITVKAKEESRPVYRLYNQNTKEHLYTSSKNEYNVLGGKGWKQEGTGWYAPKSGKAVYRMYNPKSGDHHYTADAHEAKTLSTKYGWKYDNNGKALFYSGGDVPVYRVYNKTLKRGAHHFTKSLNEYNTLPKYGWKKEGIAFYAVK